MGVGEKANRVKFRFYGVNSEKPEVAGLERV